MTSAIPGAPESSRCRALTAHAGLGIRQPLDHSRQSGESATKTVKFFAAHTVNCVICKNLTRIEWMLLNFTPVIQQNCHQPGRNFEKSFCAVDSRGWQVELSKSETSQFRSDLVFDRKLCACNLLTWGLNVVLRYLKSSDFCVAEILWASNVPEQGARPPPFILLFPFFSSFSHYFLFFPFFHFKPPINSSFWGMQKKCTSKNMHLPHNMYIMMIACAYK